MRVTSLPYVLTGCVPLKGVPPVRRAPTNQKQSYRLVIGKTLHSVVKTIRITRPSRNDELKLLEYGKSSVVSPVALPCTLAHHGTYATPACVVAVLAEPGGEAERATLL